MDDDILEGGATAEGKPEGKPDSTSTNDQASTLSEERVSEIVQESLSPVTESLASMNQFFKTLQERAAEQGNGQRPDESETDFNDRLYADAQGTIRQEIANETLPILGTAGATLGDIILESEQMQIDSKYGEGTWNEIYGPVLNGVIDDLRRSNPAQLLNKTAIKNAVQSITGRNVDALMERRDKVKTSGTQSEEAAVEKLVEATLSRSNLSGGIRRSSASEGKGLDAEQKEILALFEKETGESEDADRLASVIQVRNPQGTTLAAYQKATAKAAGE